MNLTVAISESRYLERYGGRVTDAQDKRSISSVLRRYFPLDGSLLDDDFRLSGTDTYSVPVGSVEVTAVEKTHAMRKEDQQFQTDSPFLVCLHLPTFDSLVFRSGCARIHPEAAGGGRT